MESIALNLSEDSKASQVRGILDRLYLTEKDAEKVKSTFQSELELGMKDGLEKSCLQMENTYVPEFMDGTEEGLYLALDLGGTNFRVILLELHKGKIINEIVSYYTVEESKRLGPGSELFDFLAECIADFLVKNDLAGKKIPLGFTFSFPMTQTALDVGILVTWTKSFNCPGVVGTDAVKHLNEALKRNGKAGNVEVVAVLNDTTGTLVKGAYDNPDTCIGLILGTGCNGAYLEKGDRVLRWGGNKYHAPEVVVDPEFGAFGDNGCLDFIKSEFDREIDRASLLPGSFTFEKYFSGKYIGDLVRHILVRLHKEGLVFKGQNISLLDQTGSITSSDLSDVEADSVSGTTVNTKALANRFGLELSEDDSAVIKHVCAVLSHR